MLWRAVFLYCIVCQFINDEPVSGSLTWNSPVSGGLMQNSSSSWMMCTGRGRRGWGGGGGGGWGGAEDPTDFLSIILTGQEYSTQLVCINSKKLLALLNQIFWCLINSVKILLLTFSWILSINLGMKYRADHASLFRRHCIIRKWLSGGIIIKHFALPISPLTGLTLKVERWQLCRVNLPYTNSEVESDAPWFTPLEGRSDAEKMTQAQLWSLQYVY